MAEPEDEPPLLLPCSICSRTFKPESLAKHTKVCEKQATKKRKVFDSSKQRIQGTDLAEFLPVVVHEKKSEKVASPRKRESTWKEKHLEFVRAIRAARGVEVPNKSSKSNNERCPHCDRNFGPKAFDRHMEWCKEQKARIPKSPASILAKERLEARTKYRAPPLAKSQRTLTREKYARVTQNNVQESSMGSRSAVAFSKNSQSPAREVKAPERRSSSRGEATRNRPRMSTSSPSCTVPGANRQGKKREPSASPCKRPVRSASKTTTVKSRPVKPKNEDLNNRDKTSTSSCNITKAQTTNNEKLLRKNAKSSTLENSSSEEVYDPYVSAERQMMELCSQGDFVHQPSQQNKKKKLPSESKTSTVFPAFESSHRSAFVRYSPPILSHLSNETMIPSSLIAEFEDLFISGSNKFLYSADNSVVTDEQNQNIPINLSSIGLNLPNNNPEIAQPNRKPSKIRAKMESASLSLQRSVSLMNYENDMKAGTEASNFIHSDEQNNPLPVLSEYSSFPFSSPEPSHAFPSPKSHLEKGDADRFVEEMPTLKAESSVNNELFVQSKCHSAGGKFSADSAYGSLNRRSPALGSQMPEKNDEDIEENLCIMSSSSSESSLPPLCSVQVVKREASNSSLNSTPPLAVDASPLSVPRMSKFCHECGYKYPLTMAKFCCECGVRRLTM